MTKEYVPLSEPEFEAAMHRVLRALHFRTTYLKTLRHNPLLWSRMVTEQAGVEADEVKRIAALERIIEEAALKLKSVPRQEKFYNALYHAYLQPARTLREAADLTGVSFGTFLRHRKVGATQLIELLWQREIG